MQYKLQAVPTYLTQHSWPYYIYLKYVIPISFQQ